MYIGNFLNLWIIREVDYELYRTPKFLVVPYYFDVPILQLYIFDESHVLHWVIDQFDKSLTFVYKKISNFSDCV